MHAVPTTHPLADLVAGAIGAPAAAIRVAPRRPLEHQSNRLFDVFVPGRHLIAKEFVKPGEQATAPRGSSLPRWSVLVRRDEVEPEVVAAGVVPDTLSAVEHGPADAVP
jgi:hypothetical protein